MPANARHKKARLIRDYMIEAKMITMFQEQETEDTIFFRSLYPMGEDKIQLVIDINDTIYLGVQALLIPKISEGKEEAVLSCINQMNLAFPTVKYVLTKDQGVIASMFFVADENHFNAEMTMGVIVQMMRNVASSHYATLKASTE